MSDDHDSPDAPMTAPRPAACRSGRPGSPAWCSRPPPGGCRRVAWCRRGARRLCWSGACIEAGTRAAGRSRAGSRRSPSTRSRSSRSNSTRPRRLHPLGGRGHPGQRPREAKYGETISILDTDLEALRVALSRNPWIEERRLDPDVLPHLGSQVIYRQPVAVVVPIGEERRVVVDRHGVELPSSPSQFDWAEQRPRYQPAGTTTPLIEIRGVGTGNDPTGSGLEWVRRGRRSTTSRVVQAARLAGSWRIGSRRRTRRRQPAPDFAEIYFYRTASEDRLLRPRFPAELGFLEVGARARKGSTSRGRREVGAAEPFRRRPARGELKLNRDEFLWFSPRAETQVDALRSAAGGRARPPIGRSGESSGRSPASPSR